MTGRRSFAIVEKMPQCTPWACTIRKSSGSHHAGGKHTRAADARHALGARIPPVAPRASPCPAPVLPVPRMAAARPPRPIARVDAPLGILPRRPLRVLGILGVLALAVGRVDRAGGVPAPPGRALGGRGRDGPGVPDLVELLLRGAGEFDHGVVKVASQQTAQTIDPGFAPKSTTIRAADAPLLRPMPPPLASAVCVQYPCPRCR